jgi:NAD(P)H-dependent FMN reductase
MAEPITWAPKRQPQHTEDTRARLDVMSTPMTSGGHEAAIGMVASPRALYVPVILGTVRQGRKSLPVARLVFSELSRRPGIETELIDVAQLPLPVDDAGEAIKDPGFSEKMSRSDAIVVISPEYNHGYSGLLKHVLDSCLKEYVHKAVGVVGVSAGPFGGSRGIQDLLPVLRELGLVTIFWDVNFSTVQNAFDDSGALRDQAYLPRIDKFLSELVWMATTLRHGREQVTMPQSAPPMRCPRCGAAMNHHADKVLQSSGVADESSVDPVLGGIAEELHSCPACGASASRRARARE